MDSRERVLAAIERRRPDRPATSLRFTPEAADRMRRFLGLPESDDPSSDILDELDVDLRRIYSLPFMGPKERSTRTLHGEGTDFWGIEFARVHTPTNDYFEFKRHPLAEARSVAEIDAYDWPQLDWWDYAALPEMIRRAHGRTRRAIAVFVGGVFEIAWYLRGFDQFLVDLCLQPDIANAICSHIERFSRDRALRFLDAAKGMVDIVATGSDIGEQRQMLISPKLWRERIKPFTGRLLSTFKQLGYKTFYHSCGSFVPVIGDLIELGLDVLDPIQVSATGMRPEELFPKFGDRLCFHGAIDEQRLLPHGTPEEIYRETTRTIDILGARGGYIVTSAHALQADTPPENVLAMIRAANDYRW